MTQQHHRKTRIDPNVQDPLSETTVQRRIWAAYLDAGFSRASWAEALGMSYTAVDLIDTGKVTPRLGTLMRMQELIGRFSLDELAYGRNLPQMRRSEGELSTEAIKLLLLQLRCDTDTIEALGQHTESPSGKYQRYTRTYVVAFVDRYALARADGLTRPASIDLAKAAAANAQANSEAIAQRLKPISAAELQAVGKEVKAARTTSVLRGAKQPRKRA